jgi:hypothetical protein
LYQIVLLVLACGILIAGPSGTLTIPGIIAGIMTILFVFLEFNSVVSCIGILAATVSLTAQGFFGHCYYCTAAAVLFAVVACISLFKVWPAEHFWLVLIFPLAVALCIYGFNPVLDQPKHIRDTVVNQPVPGDEQPLFLQQVPCQPCQKAMGHHDVSDSREGSL